MFIYIKISEAIIISSDKLLNWLIIW
jgi:hypothetical protein